MQYRTTTTLAAIFALMLIHTAYAAFPYNATWLNYADKRLVYQIDTSGVASNTANIYVTLDVNETFLQDFIDRWSAYCDPQGVYPWFYPTFAYASTADTTERMVEVVSFANFQTFTVGSCGTVELPTRFTVKLPNGVLDGGDNYAMHSHYIYAYLKYPYVYDGYESLVGQPPIIMSDGSAVIEFSSTFGIGHYYRVDGALDVNTSVAIDTSKRNYLCYYVYDVDDGELVPDLWLNFYLDDLNNYFQVSIDDAAECGPRCLEISNDVDNVVGSGNRTIVRWHIHDDAVQSRVYYMWLIPDSEYEYIRMHS